MACFLLKPVLWNTERYQRPSGVRAHSGYPQDNGFGHEEWNNSDRLTFSDASGSHHVFHTEPVGHAPVEHNVGQTVVFMFASHDGVQDLIAVAANATALIEEQHLLERRRLAKQLKLGRLPHEAWDVDTVQECYKYNKKAFLRAWKKNESWIPNWICPASNYLALAPPVRLNAQNINGKDRLPNRFGTYMSLEREQARSILLSVPRKQQTDIWHNVLDAVSTTPDEPTLPIGDRGSKTRVTTRIALQHARCGQGGFRESVMEKWGHACSVTGADLPELLVASHVKPWAISSDGERLDPYNGLVLVANLDALFDRGLITFDAGGYMLVSTRIRSVLRKELGIPSKLRMRPDRMLASYLAYHRENCFERS